jgi:ABC-type branched-subunit amino acid transport system ATPase component/predicted MFS family arabinose efflux permease
LRRTIRRTGRSGAPDLGDAVTTPEVEGGPAFQGDAAHLAATVLEEEAARQEAQARAKEQVIFPDDLLPGVQSEPVTFRQAMVKGGSRMFVVFSLLLALDNFTLNAITAVEPELRRTFHISSGAAVFITSSPALFYVLGAIPLGWLADRVRRRVRIVGLAAVFVSVFTFFTGIAVSAFMFFWVSAATGIAKANNIAVQPPLLADNYPIGIRARVSALMNVINQVLGNSAYIVVGLIATIAGGTEGWRWGFILLCIPAALLAVAAFSIREPPRGQFEKLDVLGEVIEDENPTQPSMEAAFGRLKKIATIKTSICAFAAMGFGVFALTSLQVLYLNDTLHQTDILKRGAILTFAGLVVVPFLYPVGSYFDRVYRRDPARALVLVALLLLPSAIFTPLQVSTHSVTWFVILGIPQSVLTGCAFAMVTPVLQAVCPYRLRGMGIALGVMYVVLIGGFGGNILAGFFTDAFGVRATVFLLSIPSTVIGSLMLMNGARFIRHDLSLVVEELLEEQEEQRKRAAEGARTPVLQVVNIDFSYGPVQVLFDMNFEVHRGECVALLGTNGAGKSTILRVISGLEVPERGVIRFNGRNFTYVAPEQRVKHGIVQLPGGKGVFPSLTVEQNLAISARLLSKEQSVVDAHIAEVLTRFPELAERRKQSARSLSGGQQQMLALARVLIHKPEILLIDELSLGLAPVVVQRMLELVDELKASGQTMIIVEQSLNVALAIADRAIFLEKGEVKFEGPAQDLLERDDLARAVFFGTEGG